MGFWFLQLGLSQNPPFHSDKFPYPLWNLFFVLWSMSLSLRSCVVLFVCCNMWTLSLLISYQVWIYFFQFRCSWLYHNYWYAKMFILYVLMIFKQISRSISCGWECVLGERSVWFVLCFVFDKKCVRVTSEREEGYGTITEWSIGG